MFLSKKLKEDVVPTPNLLLTSIFIISCSCAVYFAFRFGPNWLSTLNTRKIASLLWQQHILFYFFIIFFSFLAGKKTQKSLQLFNTLFVLSIKINHTQRKHQKIAFPQLQRYPPFEQLGLFVFIYISCCCFVFDIESYWSQIVQVLTEFGKYANVTVKMLLFARFTEEMFSRST